jgi:hypothetical protein
LSFSHSPAAPVFVSVMVGLTGQFFRLMSSIVSFISWAALAAGIRSKIKRNPLN